jgi:ribose-phosphate pyrophosphokinase
MAIAEQLDEPLVKLHSDGSAETGANISVSSDERVVVVASTTSSRAHLELLDLQERASARNPDEIITVLPYMGYARQDKQFEDGEPISARAVARAISTGTDRVYCVNPHNVSILDYFGIPAEPIDAAPQLATPLPDDLVDPVFLGPDEDAVWIAESVRDAYGEGEIDNFEKFRHSATDVAIDASGKDYTERDVILVDDMIATGGTMSEAVQIINQQETNHVYVSCVHPVLVDDAPSKLYRAGVKSIYATNTIDRSISTVSAAPPIVDVL